MPEDSPVVQQLRSLASPDRSTTLHEHLCRLLTNLPTPADQLNSLAHLEHISQFIKRTRFVQRDVLTEDQVRSKAMSRAQYPGWLLQEEQIRGKVQASTRDNSGNLIQNFERDNQVLFEQAGVSFGAEITSKINAALRYLAQKQNAVSLRFWGKILATRGDYYVIQGISRKKKQPIVTEGMQKYREGVNYYSYWVCQQILSDQWYQLPLVTPEQITVSRLIKHIFTGNLSEPVHSYPTFSGQERHLLKCQLVRITHNCQIAPNGLYTKMEEGEQIEFAQEFKMPEFNDLANLENWVHVNPYILGVGRADYYKDPKLTEEQREQQLAKLAESDPKIDRLKAINEDKPIQKLSMETSWVAKPVGNLQVFNGKQQGTTSVYACVTLRNPHWPGWLTVSNSKTFGSIYIGYGYKQTQDCFYPSGPQDLEVQGVERDEFDEPNPRDPPDELEPDSDDENKKPQDA